VLQPSLALSGRVHFDGSSAAPQSLESVRVSLRPILTGAQIAVGQPNGVPDAQGAFTISGATPGRYQVFASVPSSPAGSRWLLRSAMINGIDASERPFELKPGEAAPELTVTFTDRTTEISGLLQDTSGRPAPDHFILLFPTDKALWPAGLQTRQARPASDGRFTLARLRPGEYYLVALTDLASEDLQDPSYLDQIARSGIKLTVAEGERKVQDLRIAK
jgi:hypothetical protein